METLVFLALLGGLVYVAVQKLVLEQRCVSCHRPRIGGAVRCPYCGADYPPRAARAMELVVLNGPLQGSRFALTTPVFEIGAGAGLDLQLPDRSVLARHAAISAQQGRYVLFPRQGGASVLVNGYPVVQPHMLRVNDRIQLGATVLALRAGPFLAPSRGISAPVPQFAVLPPWGAGLSSMRSERRLSGGGALLALLCFFMPWLSVSCSGSSLAYSGYALASNSSLGNSWTWLLWLAPPAALAVLWLLYRTLAGDTPDDHRLATQQLAAGLAGMAPTVMLFIALEQARRDPRNLAVGLLINLEPGYWLTLLGFIGVVVGAALDRQRHHPQRF
ncbi:MAG: FHA domain-containing protein [Chloroflexi bacterium]|nr:FHA domain-containing protein [Chloroflexota bacterium]